MLYQMKGIENMICKGCGINVNYKTDKCPLCGREFSVAEQEELKDLRAPYPIEKKEIQPVVSFSTRYFFFALVLLIPLAIVNGIYNDTAWSVAAVFGLLSLYLFLRYTLFDHGTVAFNLTINTLSLSAFFLALEHGAKLPMPSLSYILPAFFFLAMMCLSILQIVKNNGNRQGSWGLSLLFYLLILGQFYANIFLNNANYFNVVVTIFSTVYISVTCFLKGREILKELKTFFAV